MCLMLSLSFALLNVSGLIKLCCKGAVKIHTSLLVADWPFKIVCPKLGYKLLRPGLNATLPTG